MGNQFPQIREFSAFVFVFFRTLAMPRLVFESYDKEQRAREGLKNYLAAAPDAKRRSPARLVSAPFQDRYALRHPS